MWLITAKGWDSRSRRDVLDTTLREGTKEHAIASARAFFMAVSQDGAYSDWRNYSAERFPR